jgi:hypothetical protein
MRRKRLSRQPEVSEKESCCDRLSDDGDRYYILTDQICATDRRVQC